MRDLTSDLTAAHPFPAPVQDVRVDHGGTHILAAQQLLHGADIVACFEEPRSETMPKGVTASRLRDPRPAYGPFDPRCNIFSST